MKKILMISSECFPYARTGGLSEVIPALSEALNRSSKEVRVQIIIPFYREVSKNAPSSAVIESCGYKSKITIDGRDFEGELFTTSISKKTRLYFVKNDHFFDREGIYRNEHGDYPDNADRFYFFSQFIVNAIIDSVLETDILHVHDWHSSLIPALIKSSYKKNEEINKKLDKIKTLLSIHNIGYQGILSAKVCRWAGFDLNDFPETIFGKLDGENTLNFLKTGIYFADKINTVSPTYAKEIQGVEYGFGLESLLQTRRSDLLGIINGANYETWSPEKDKLIPANYTSSDLRGKEICKKALSEYLGFEYEKDVPIIGVIARLSYQKGLDLLVSVWEEFCALNMKFVVLGNGDDGLETFFLSQANQNSNKIGVKIEFDVKLSHLIQAGSDMFLMPSRYEPCGLTQIHGMKYGTIPIVRETGGLKDTVENYNEENSTGTGFIFKEINSRNMLNEIKRALYAYNNKEVWNRIMKSAMAKDFSYLKVSSEYLKLYNSMM